MKVIELDNRSENVNRKKLAQIVFSDKNNDKLETLNRITHKYVLKRTHELIERYSKQSKVAVVVDAPLLFEADFDKFCDFSIAVIASKETRITRIIERDGLAYNDAVMRVNAQNCDEFYSSRATYTVTNNEDAANLECQLYSILDKENLIL